MLACRTGGQAVASYDSVLDGAKIVATAVDTFGRLDIVINNAGIAFLQPFTRLSEEQWRKMADVHVNGSYSIMAAAWPHFIKQKYG